MNRQQLRSENMAIQRRYEIKFHGPVAKSIQSTVDETISAVKRNGVHGGVAFLHKKLLNPGLTAELLKMDLEVAQRFARRQWMEFTKQKRSAKGFGFNEEWIKRIKDLLHSFIVQQSFSIFSTTKDVLIRTLNKSIQEGWGVDKTVQALEELKLSDYQAARIVRTEITRASNTGTQVASESFPYEQSKEWLSAHDDRVRGIDPKDHASHVALDGNVVDVDSVFIDPRNGDQLRFPGDPLASAESTINCRCSMAVVGKVNARGRLIPRHNVAA